MSSPNKPAESKAKLPKFYGFIQLVLLLSLLPSIYSYALYGWRPVVIAPYYFQPNLGNQVRFFPDSYTKQSTVFYRKLEETKLEAVQRRFVWNAAATPEGAGRGTYEYLAFLCILGIALWLYALFTGQLREAFWRLLLGLAVPNTVLLLAGYYLATNSHLPPELAFAVAPKIAMFWFAARGRFLSRSTLLFALPLVVLMIAAPASSNWILEGLVPLVVFVLAILLLRLVIWVANENSYFLRQLGWVANLRNCAHALLLWLPMLALCLPYFIARDKIEESLRESLHQEPAAALVQRAANTQGIPDSVNDARPIVMMMAASGYWRGIDGIKNMAANQQLAIAQLRAKTFEALVMAEFNNALPVAITFPQVDTSGFWGPAKAAGANAAEVSVNFAYKGIRAGLETRVRARARDAQATFDKGLVTASQIVAEVERDTVNLLFEASKATQSGIWSIFAYLSAAHLLGLLLFAFICVKSFLYVFSRVAFHRTCGSYLTLGKVDGTYVPEEEARIEQHQGRFVLQPKDACVFYASRKFQGVGRPPKLAWPQPLHAPIARVLHRATAMNKVVFDSGNNKSPVSYTAKPGSQFVVWNLRGGEEVVFNFHHFVAMEESVKISTLISVRLSTLLLGRFIYSTATGPGQLILLTEGRADITGRDGGGDSLPPDRLVCMHRDARLNVDSELGLVDVYFSDAYVKATGGGQVLVDVDRQTGASSGLGRFIRHFLWPG